MPANGEAQPQQQQHQPQHQQRPKKLQRISQACDLCHRRSIRCRPSNENAHHQCQNCYDFGVDCTYNRPSRRRRNQSQAGTAQPPNQLPSQQHAGYSSLSPRIKIEGQDGSTFFGYAPSDFTGAYGTIREGRPEDPLGTAWRSFGASNADRIVRLMDVYLDVVYPVFPLFHAPTLQHCLQKRDYLHDPGLFVSVMAACALAAARERDGATGADTSFVDNSDITSETYFRAAVDVMPKDISRARGPGYMRACALLAVTSIQYGEISKMHHYIGLYHTLSAMQEFHDENNWPEGLTCIEEEERRRLFWSMYSLDVYTSIVFNSVLKSQENFSNVRYPREISDEELQSLPAGMASPVTNDDCWLRGWNFTIDLYRILEHTVARLRRNQEVHREDRVSIARMVISDGVTDAQVMQNVFTLYHRLPERFKDYKMAATGERSHDIFGFQAANIQATLQLVRMTVFACNNWSDIDKKCEIAHAVIEAFFGIQTRYLHAISTPLVYHLGAIGQILASVMQGPLREEPYIRVRDLLTRMADLLQRLEQHLQPTAGASQGLKTQIDKIDRYMDEQRKVLANLPNIQPNINALPNNVGANSVPAYTNGTATSQPPQMPLTNSLGMRTPLDEFQLPHEVIGEWPWPFEMTQEQNGHAHHTESNHQPIVASNGGDW